MKARLLAFLLGTGMVLMGPACANRKAQGRAAADSKFSPVTLSPSNPLITPSTMLTGKVVKVNAEARFVVLSFPLGKMPALEQRLAVFHAGLKTGELRVTGPQRDDKIVADLTAGQAAVGDEVRDQ